MSYVVLDFETYYDKEYSLKKMTPVEYLHDPRFEMIGCGVVDPNVARDAFWVDAEDFLAYARDLKQRKDLTVLSHNALFDMCLLHWHYDVLPDLMVDTMGMARALIIGRSKWVSLDKCAEHLGLPAKGKTILKVVGMHAADIKAAGFWDEYTDYACNDAELCEGVFKALAPKFPREEYTIMDMVLRMAVVPRFKLNPERLAIHKSYLARQKELLLQRAGLANRTELMSNDKFAEALRRLGVGPGMKTSPKTGKEAYAFAKTDPFMIDLEEHPNPAVQALHAARIGHKSTIEETRTERLLKISLLEWPDGSKGWAPIPLRYSGAHTHRLSGDWGLNAQNWPKYTVWEDGSKTTGELRLAHEAPEGRVVVKADASQIEARIVAWLAGATELVEAFRQKRDIYSEFAEEVIFGYPVNKGTVDERFVGKNTILGAGFGMGPDRFIVNLAMISYSVLGREIKIPFELSHKAIHGYRRKYPEVPAAWKQCKDFLPQMARKGTNIDWGPVTIRHEEIILPNGLPLQYPGLHWDPDAKDGSGSWVCTYAGKPKYLFGGKIYENIVQALARILTMQAAARMKKRFPKVPLSHQIHDDIIYLPRLEEGPEFRAALTEEMATGLWWSEGLPLASESGMGPSYGECKED